MFEPGSPLFRHFLIYVFIAVTGFESGGFAHSNTPDFQALSEKQFWLRLGHYKKSIFGNLFNTWSSGVDGDAFFLSSQGKSSPFDELKATWQALEENKTIQIHTPSGPLNGPARCFFPARAQLIEKETGHLFPKPPCKEFESWLKKIAGQSVSLIFSSYYNGAPASMFGHSFLRISRARSDSAEPGNPLLDLTVDFSAQTQGENRVLEAFKGLLGFYPGRYGLWPYYVKVKEYNHSENRDLFEYPLNFSPDETETLLSHIWELSYSYSDYYFFNRNCSFQLLTILEVAKPAWKMQNYRVFAVPIDTIRDVLEQPAAKVRKNEGPYAGFRISLSERLKNTFDLLSVSDQKTFKNLTREDHQTTAFAQTLDNVAVMNALAIHYLVLQMEHKGELPPLLAQRHRELLARRANFQESKSADDAKTEAVSPDLGHPTSRIELGALLSHQKPAALTLSWRPALHDLLGEDAGYNAFSRLEIFSTELSYRPEPRTFALEHMTVLGITSLSASHPTQSKWSYVWDFYGEQARGLGCSGCFVMGLKAGVGKAFGFPTRASGSVYSMLIIEGQTTPTSSQVGRFGPGVLLGGVWDLWGRGKLSIQESIQLWAMDQGRLTSDTDLGLSVFPRLSARRDWEVRASANSIVSILGRNTPEQALRLAIGKYF